MNGYTSNLVPHVFRGREFFGGMELIHFKNMIGRQIINLILDNIILWQSSINSVMILNLALESQKCHLVWSIWNHHHLSCCSIFDRSQSPILEKTININWFPCFGLNLMDLI
jgi:hypothetical protein